MRLVGGSLSVTADFAGRVLLGGCGDRLTRYSGEGSVGGAGQRGTVRGGNALSWSSGGSSTVSQNQMNARWPLAWGCGLDQVSREGDP